MCVWFPSRSDLDWARLGTSATPCGLWECHDYEWPPAWLGKNNNSQEITSKKLDRFLLLMKALSESPTAEDVVDRLSWVVFFPHKRLKIGIEVHVVFLWTSQEGSRILFFLVIENAGVGGEERERSGQPLFEAALSRREFRLLDPAAGHRSAQPSGCGGREVGSAERCWSTSSVDPVKR